MTPYLHREIRSVVEPALQSMPVVVITGMRQTGKTTFLQNDPLFKGYSYLTLDDFPTLQTATAQPEALIETGDKVIIDEAQKAPELLTAVKRAVDRKRTPGRFVLSGSANFSLLKAMAESLAGRAIYLALHPFTRREISGTIRPEPFLVNILNGTKGPPQGIGVPIEDEDVLLGGMPSATELTHSNASLWFRSYEQTYVERDIREIARVDDTLGFRNLIKLAALRSGQILNTSQLARDTLLSVATTTRYLRLAETSFLFRRLGPFLRSRSSRLIKAPKLYVADSGVACHLAGVDRLGSADNERLRGVLFETYALQNILSIVESWLPGARVSYWHVQGRHEVDFIIEHGKTCVALEIKAGRRWSGDDLTSLKVFLEKTPSCRAGIIAYNGNQTAQLGDKLWAVPLGTLLM